MEKQIIPNHEVDVPKLKLEEMFKLQTEFQSRFYDLKQIQKLEQTGLDYMKLMLLCIHSETSEALDWLNWKPWKQTKKEFNRYEFLNELVDAQHFLINAALGVGCTAEEFAALFFNKQYENVKRQQRSY